MFAAGTGIPLIVSSSRYRRAMVASTSTVSSSANDAPTQAARGQEQVEQVPRRFLVYAGRRPGERNRRSADSGFTAT
jgi:hypothetical protein